MGPNHGLDDLQGGPLKVTAAGKRWINTKPKGTEVMDTCRRTSSAKFTYA